MVKIVTDDASDIPEYAIKKYNITILKHPLYFGDEEVTGISPDQFYKRLKNGEMPRTTLLPTGVLVNTYLACRQTGKKLDTDTILSIHISSKMSGTYNSALTAAEMVKDIVKVEVFETGLTTLGQGMITLESAIEAFAGQGIKSVKSKAEEVRSKVKMILAIPDLNFLHRGGRLGKGKVLLGAMMRIIPMVTYVDGEIVPFGRVRTASQAISKVKDEIKKDLAKFKDKRLKVLLGYTTDKRICKELDEAIRNEFPVSESHIIQMNSVVGVYLGPGAWGISYYPIGG
ncbi:DegV family protein [candidate division WOR-3 bacterium]|nr:DegV family protein [candidate division WOR-3 bacterium]MCK4330304.1 DegV family protein [candidate division WOR-3 bacterium]